MVSKPTEHLKAALRCYREPGVTVGQSWANRISPEALSEFKALSDLDVAKALSDVGGSEQFSATGIDDPWPSSRCALDKFYCAAIKASDACLERMDEVLGDLAGVAVMSCGVREIEHETLLRTGALGYLQERQKSFLQSHLTQMVAGTCSCKRGRSRRCVSGVK